MRRHPRSPRFRASAFAAALGLGLSLLSAQAAVAWPDGPRPSAGASTPGNQPLPGYTVEDEPLEPLVIDGQKTTVFQGVHRHAAYRLEVPASWNGELFMWAHGYRAGNVLTVDEPAADMRERLLRQGYAWAASSYKKNYYNVAVGVRSTQELARHAETLLGQEPTRVYIAGQSMGGHVVARSIEEYPNLYAGALPMCGVIGDHQFGDYVLSVNLVAQALADHPAFPTPADYYTEDRPAIQKALGMTKLTPGGRDTTNRLGKQYRKIVTNLSGGKRPGAKAAFAHWKDGLFTLVIEDTGGPLAEFDMRIGQNLDTTYSPNHPADVNETVLRVPTGAKRVRQSSKLTVHPRIDGKPRVPVLNLQALGDLFVPFSMAQIYQREVTAHGRSDLLVQRAIRSAGHCEFTPTEVGSAWDDLVDWVESRDAVRDGAADTVLRPAGDSVLNRRKVASPTYGCRFTDPAASDADYPTRAYYAPCRERS